MKMFGTELYSMQDLKDNFSIDELIYSYYSGELAVFLDSIGEFEISQKLDNIRHNGYLLTELYKLFGLNPETSEEDLSHSGVEFKYLVEKKQLKHNAVHDENGITKYVRTDECTPFTIVKNFGV